MNVLSPELASAEALLSPELASAEAQRLKATIRIGTSLIRKSSSRCRGEQTYKFKVWVECGHLRKYHESSGPMNVLSPLAVAVAKRRTAPRATTSFTRPSMFTVPHLSQGPTCRSPRSWLSKRGMNE
jgi:hypothetical protein